MRYRNLSMAVVLTAYTALGTFAQTQKSLTNADVINMTKQGLDAGLIVKSIQSSNTAFDTTPQTLIDLKNSGVDNSVIDAMLSAQASRRLRWMRSTVPRRRRVGHCRVPPNRVAARVTVACSRKGTKYR